MKQIYFLLFWAMNIIQMCPIKKLYISNISKRIVVYVVAEFLNL